VVKRITRLSPRIVVTFAALAALVAGGLFAVTARSSFASPKPGVSRSSNVSSFTAKRGAITARGKVIVANIGKLGSAPAQHGSGGPHVAKFGARPAQSRASGVVGQRPSASSNGVSKGTVLANFDGVNEIQNNNASATPLEPPDEGMGAGGGYVVNFVNVTGSIYTTGGATVAGPFALYAFFNESPTANLSDPRVFYDSKTHTWFANLFEYGGNSNTESHIDLAVNTGNPVTGVWNIYTLDSSDVSTPNCPCFPDYTIFGIDQNNVYLSGNEFSLAGSAFNGAEIWAISKSELEAGVTASFAYWNQLSMGGAPAYHVQPAITYGSPSAEYFMNSLDPNNTFDNRLGVWALTNGASITTGSGVPSLTSTIISSEAYAMPLNVPTPPGFNTFFGVATTGVVTGDFDAMQEVQYINGHLDGALNTSVNIAGDTGARDGVAWFQVTPSLSNGGISPTTHVAHQGYVSLSGEYLLYPHINEVPDGGMALTFGLGGPNTYLSAAYATKSAGASNFGVVQIAAGGVAPDNGFTMTPGFGGVGRWGDYSAGEIDYSHNTVWLATQYIPNNGDIFANWGNRIFEVQL